jgi:hypothetical protein
VSDFEIYLNYGIVLGIALLLGFAWVWLLSRNSPTLKLFSVEGVSYVLISGIQASIVLIIVRGFGLLDFRPTNNFITASSYLMACLLGALFGIAELVSRYRDEPRRALWTWAAFLYVFVNALASMGALNLIRVFDWISGGAPLQDAYKQVLVAGLGAMALFRSSLFIFRIGDSEINFGPVFVLQILLGVADRGVDRNRGWSRSADVGDIMKDVSFEKARVLLPIYCLGLMQNLSKEEQESIGRDVIAIAEIRLDDEIIANRQKSVLLGLKLLNVVGTDLLKQAVKSLGDDIKRIPTD